MTLNDYRLRLADWTDAHLIRSALVLLAAVLAIVVLVTFCAGRADADDLRVSWTPATTRTNGVPMPASEIREHQVLYGQCVAGGLPANPQSVVVAMPATTTLITGLAPATWCAGVKTVDTDGRLSAISNVPVKAILAPPAAPIVTVAVVARVMAGRWVGAVAGRVDLGVACGARRSGQWHEVERSSVDLNRYGRSLPRGAVIVAQCG